MNYLQWFYTVYFISLTSAGLTFAYSVYTKPRNELRLISLLLLASFLADFISAMGNHVFHHYIPYTGAIYRIIELVLLLEFYKRLFPEKKNLLLIRLLQFDVPVLFIFFTPFDVVSLRLTNCVVFVIYSIIYFNKLLKEMKLENPLNDPIFWVNSANIVYFSSILFLLMFFRPLANIHEASAVITYMFHNVFLILKNAFFAVAFWKGHQQVIASKPR